MEQETLGTILSSQLSIIGGVMYGFLEVETDDHETIDVKVDADTKYYTLDVGARVCVVGEIINNTGSWAAKIIERISDMKSMDHQNLSQLDSKAHVMAHYIRGAPQIYSS